jgi:trimeric autotransporter adhesin
MKFRIVCVVVGCLLLVVSLASQTPAANLAASVQVPPLIQFSNVATDEGGNTLSGVVSITFSLYTAQQGNEPLWTETQNNVQLDPTGHYSVQLGITKPNGVPTTLFTSGEARWLGVQIAQQPEQPRVLLLSVPYALKAGDAATIGGLPPSAFVLAAAGSGAASTYIAESSTGQSVSPETAADVTTTGGTADYLPMFSGADTILDSVVFQSAAAPFKIGIGTATPATTLDVAGAATIRGTLALPATAAATATVGKSSAPLTLTASAFNSTSSTAVNQTFQWQAEAAGNDTTTPSGTLNLLFGEGTTTPSQTGLSIASDGQITFATGQTLPNVSGNETVSGSITATSFSGSGSGLTNVTAANASELGGLAPSAFAKLAAANTFTANQTVNGNLSATGVVTGSSYQIGNNLFAFGSFKNVNAFLGFAGNTTMTGTGNTGSGYNALLSNTTGIQNTADGFSALHHNTTGTQNTADGYDALLYNNTGNYNTGSGYATLYSNTTGGNNTASGYNALSGNTTGDNNTASGYSALGLNTTGSNNTALGYQANVSASNFSNAAAIGANAVVSASNALVLGGTGSNAVNVGIGTATPGFTLDVEGTGTINAATSYNLGGSSFAFGSNNNAFLATGAGNFTMTGSWNLGIGAPNPYASGGALSANSTGFFNTAVGSGALSSNTVGEGNTAVGALALAGAANGYYNTAVGYEAGYSANLRYSTAIGAGANVSISHAVVLGGTGDDTVSVGIGTAAPAATLDVYDNGSGGNTISATSAAVNNAVYGINNSTSGNANGASFWTSSPAGTAIVGVNTGTGGNDYAAYLQGNVYISGNLAKSTGTFQIDHPLDPANKYLYHSFVESPDMMNIYNGVATLDARGSVWITLPEYFEALNQDFRYQLTSMGRPQPSLYVAKEISGNRFRISGGKPGGKVSWQVTGIRHDAYADAHRIQVEVEKPAQEQGRYLHPELFGAPVEQAIGYHAPPLPRQPPTQAETAHVSALK